MDLRQAVPRRSQSLAVSASEIGGMVGLYELWLDSNELVALPPEIGNLEMKLQRLDASHNSLETLPNEFGRLAKMPTLFLNHNREATLRGKANLPLFGAFAFFLIPIPEGHAIFSGMRYGNRAVARAAFWFSIAAWTSEVLAQSAPFIHPGGLHKLSDLERMKYQVAARVDPWYTSFQQLRNHSGASMNYAVRGDPTWTVVNRDPCNRCSEFLSDATAAYLNSLMWAITGDSRHADKAVQIFNAWKNLTEFTGGGTEALNAGIFAWKMVEAAEIIQSTYPGWSPSDRQQFKDMLVYPGYSNTARPSSVSDSNGTFYWRMYNGDPGRHGNQDLIAWRAMITMGVFLDNRILFDRALRYFKGQPHRADDIPYASGPGVSGSQTDDNPYFTTYNSTRQNTVPDYGYNGVLEHYIWENGQNQESSRDQQHAFFGLGTCQGIAEVAWNQGDSAWNSLDHRLRTGFEFMARYNTSFIQSFPDQTTPWEPTNVLQRTDRTGRWRTKAINPYFDNDFIRLSRGDFSARPVYEQATAHFTVRMGFTTEALWTLRSRDVAITRFGHETNGFNLDHPGWGALTFRRPPLAAGDPISGYADGIPVFKMPVVPVAIDAENFDHFPADGQGKTYHDLTPGNRDGQYRLREAVDIAASTGGGYHLTDLQSGEWVTYTLYVPTAGNYALTLRYSANAGGGGVRFAFNGRNPGDPVLIPFGAPHSTGSSDWKSWIADTVALAAGVQSMRVHFTGTDNVWLLDGVTVAAPGTTIIRRGKTGSQKMIGLYLPGSFSGPYRVTVHDATGRTVLRGRDGTIARKILLR